MVKMRVNQKQSSKCQGCGNRWKNVKEMYDLQICDTKFTLCSNCTDKIFHKLLRAECMYNSRLKSQEDMERVRNNNKMLNPVKAETREDLPVCYGEFLKQKYCKKCKYLYECKDIHGNKEE